MMSSRMSRAFYRFVALVVVVDGAVYNSFITTEDG